MQLEKLKLKTPSEFITLQVCIREKEKEGPEKYYCQIEAYTIFLVLFEMWNVSLIKYVNYNLFLDLLLQCPFEDLTSW